MVLTLGSAVWANVAGGWHTHLAILEDRPLGRVPQPFFPAFEPIEAAYVGRFGASEADAASSGAAASLRIVRRFDVAPEVVFEALTVPEAMRVWWTEQTTFDLDLRVGGRWTIVRTDGDETFVMEGVGCVVVFEQSGVDIASELRDLAPGAR